MRCRVQAVLPFTLVLVLWGQPSVGLEPEDGAVFVRVVDTGAALCCIIKTSDNQFIIYDAGHWAGDGGRAFDGVQEIVRSRSPVALMVLSHTDSDHLGAVKAICDGYRVETIVWPGLTRTTGTWRDASGAIRRECAAEGCTEINLRTDSLPTETHHYGQTKVSFICGWQKPPEDWPLDPESSEWLNAGSIIVRLEFAGKSVLFAGDAVGRLKEDPPGTCIATEKYVCDHAAERPVKSDVIIAPHHGGNNASSERFIEAVDPKWVVFSAGHNHHHPTEGAAQRYLDHHIPAERMLRTDRRDNEPDEPDEQKEWKYGSKRGHKDKPGDDDVDILIRPNGQLLVAYRNPDPEDENGGGGWHLAAPDAKGLRMARVLPEKVLREEAMSPEQQEGLDRLQPRQPEPPSCRCHSHRPRLRRHCW
jgi:beta-lactamase superfamily II metal-dependent hydrolase